MGVQNLRSLAGIHDRSARAGRLSTNQQLEALADGGEISRDLLPRPEDRAAVAGRPITPVDFMMREAGISGSDPVGRFMAREPGYVAGAEVLFAGWVEQVWDRAMYGHSLGHRFASTTGDVFLTDPSSAGDTLYPSTIGGIADEQAEVRNLVSLADLVRSSVGINSDGFKGAYLLDVDESDTSKEPARTAESAELPRYTIAHGEREVRIYKYGAAVERSYEVMRRIQIDLVADAIGEIARQEARRKVRDAINVAVNGDGNSNPASNVQTGATLGIDDFADFEDSMSDEGREPAVYIGDKTRLTAARKLFTPVLTTSGRMEVTAANMAYFNTYQTTTMVPLRRAMPGSVLDGVAKFLARAMGEGLTLLRENGSLIEESDRFITRQVDVFTFSENSGFMKPNANSFWTMELA